MMQAFEIQNMTKISFLVSPERDLSLGKSEPYLFELELCSKSHSATTAGW